MTDSNNRTDTAFSATWGFIDRHGDLVIPPQFTEVSAFSCGFAAVQRGTERFWIDPSGQALCPPPGAVWLADWRDDLGVFGVHRGHEMLYGAIDRAGKVVLPPEFRKIDGFSEGCFAVVDAGGTGFFLSPDGQRLQIDAVLAGEGARHGDRYEIRNLTRFVAGLAWVHLWRVGPHRETPLGWTTIDRGGHVFMPLLPDIAEVEAFVDGHARCRCEERRGKVVHTTYGYLTRDRRLLGNATFNRLGPLRASGAGSLAAWRHRGPIALRETDGVPAHPRGSEAQPNACVHDTCGFLGSDGRIHPLDTMVLAVADYADGLAAVSMNLARAGAATDTWGYLSCERRLVIMPQFEGAGDFAEGVAPVRSGGLWGYIDQHGAWEIGPRFTAARPFARGVAQVALDGLWGLIDREGQFVVTPRFTKIGAFNTDPAARPGIAVRAAVLVSHDPGFSLPETNAPHDKCPRCSKRRIWVFSEEIHTDHTGQTEKWTVFRNGVCMNCWVTMVFNNKFSGPPGLGSDFAAWDETLRSRVVESMRTRTVATVRRD